jgi:hypothetical protein
LSVLSFFCGSLSDVSSIPRIISCLSELFILCKTCHKRLNFLW